MADLAIYPFLDSNRMLAFRAKDSYNRTSVFYPFRDPDTKRMLLRGKCPGSAIEKVGYPFRDAASKRMIARVDCGSGGPGYGCFSCVDPASVFFTPDNMLTTFSGWGGTPVLRFGNECYICSSETLSASGRKWFWNLSFINGTYIYKYVYSGNTTLVRRWTGSAQSRMRKTWACGGHPQCLEYNVACDLYGKSTLVHNLNFRPNCGTLLVNGVLTYTVSVYVSVNVGAGMTAVYSATVPDPCQLSVPTSIGLSLISSNWGAEYGSRADFYGASECCPQCDPYHPAGSWPADIEEQYFTWAGASAGAVSVAFSQLPANYQTILNGYVSPTPTDYCDQPAFPTPC
jgi:hypothetical protein